MKRLFSLAFWFRLERFWTRLLQLTHRCLSRPSRAEPIWTPPPPPTSPCTAPEQRLVTGPSSPPRRRRLRRPPRVQVAVEALETRLVPNTAPVAYDDGPWEVVHGETFSSSSAAVHPLDNDTDNELDTLSLVIVDGPLHGTASLTGGVFLYTASAYYEGADSLTYRAFDGTDYSNLATISFSVTNTEPSSIDLTSNQVDENAATNTVIGTLSASDMEEDDLTFSLVNSAGGRFKIVGNQLKVDNGSLLNYEAATSHNITVRVTDQVGAYTDGIFTINVENVNEAPTDFTLSHSSIDENRSLDVVGTFTTIDPDGDSSEYSLVAGTGDDDNDFFGITYNWLQTNAQLDFETRSTYTVRVRSTDNGSLSVEKVFLITLNNVNEVPIAGDDDTYTVIHDRPLQAFGTAGGYAPTLFENDEDDDGDVLTVTRIDGVNYTPGTQRTLLSGAKLTIYGDGSFVYLPPAGYTGYDSWSYRVSDGALSDEGTATIEVTNNAVVANDDGYFSVIEYETLIISNPLQGLLGNDTDADGDTLTITQINGSAAVFDTPISLGSGGSLTVHANGTFSYTAPDSIAGTDSVTYVISDGVTTDEGYLNFSLASFPLVVNDDLAHGDEDEELLIPVLSNDMIASGTGTLAIDSVGSASHGSVTITLDGKVSYTPDENWSGSDSFNYTATDGLGHYATATVEVEIQAVNDAPTVDLPSSPVVDEDDSVDLSGIEILDVDVGEGTIQVILSVSHGTLTLLDDVADGLDEEDIDGNGTSYVVLSGTRAAINTTLAETEGLVYQGALNFNGTDELSVFVDDLGNTGAGGSLTTTTHLSITVDPVNDDPVAQDDAYTTNKNEAVTIAVLVNDTDVDGDELTVDDYDDGAHGTVTLDLEGSLVYTPDTDYVGLDSFAYTISDGNGGLATATVWVMVGDGQWATTLEDYGTFYDAGPYDWYAIQALGVPNTFEYGDIGTAWAPEGMDFDGDTFDWLTVGFDTGYTWGIVIRQSYGTGFVTLIELYNTSSEEFEPIWDIEDLSPLASIVFDQVQLDLDNKAPLNFTLTWPTTTYTVSAVRITVALDQVEDEWEEIDAVRLLGTITDTPGDAPEAAADSDTVAEDDWVSIPVLANDTLDGLVFLSIDTQPEHGYVYIDNNESPLDTSDDRLVYVPDPDFNGADSFVYAITDLFGRISTATVSITVTPVNDEPSAWDFHAVAEEDGSAELDLLADAAEDVDEGDTLTLDITGAPQHGSATVDDGLAIYEPDEDYVGPDSFQFTVDDGNGGLATATVYLWVYGSGYWAETVEEVTSEYTDSEDPENEDWNASQVLGVPDTDDYGDQATSWAGEEADAGLQTITLSFATATVATGVLVRETNASGFVTKVELLDDLLDVEYLWEGVDPSQPGYASELVVRFPETTNPITYVRITVDTDHAEGEWEEIDAVRLLTGGTFAEVTAVALTNYWDNTWSLTEANAAGQPTLILTYEFDTLIGEQEITYSEPGGYVTSLTVTDSEGNATQSEYNEAGQITAQTVGLGTGSEATTEYEYTDGVLTGLTDPNENEWHFGYDAAGNQDSITDPNGYTTTLDFDDNNRVVTLINRNNLLITFDYDSFGRKIEEVWYATNHTTVLDTLTFSYTVAGYLASASNHYGSYTFVYNDHGQLIEVDEPTGFSFTFGYDENGHRNLIEDSLGGRIDSTYNELGQLTSRLYTQDGMPTLRIDQTYDAFGRLETQTRYSDEEGTEVVATSHYEYNDSGRLINLEHKDGTNDPLAAYEWEYNSIGQLIRWVDHGVEHDYTYDPTGQLLSDNLDEWSYDANGNRDMEGYEYENDDTNQMTSDGVWDFTYDHEGNLTKKVLLGDGLTWTYQYDHRNHLVRAERRTTDEGTLELSVDYEYDVFGNRIEKRVDWDGEGGGAAAVERYALEGWNPAKSPSPLVGEGWGGGPVGNENWDVYADLAETGDLVTRYLRGDVVDQLFARVEANGDAYWYLTDHLGSIRDVLDDEGAVVNTITYDAFGNIIAETEDDYRGRYAWTGREYDVETDLQYNRARYYDPTIGRWISQDPMGFAAGDSNLYRYLHNEVVNATDPSGLRETDDDPRNPHNKGLVDVRGKVEKFLNVELRKMAKLATSANDLLERVYKRFGENRPGSGLDFGISELSRIAGDLENRNTGLLDFTKREIAVIPFNQSKYRNNKLAGTAADIIKRVPPAFLSQVTVNHMMAPTINLGGNIIGTDKLEHFFQQGYWLWAYQKQWVFNDGFESPKLNTIEARYEFSSFMEGAKYNLLNRRPYQLTDQTMLRMAQGFESSFSRKGYYGSYSTGIVSLADAHANESGYLFYSDLYTKFQQWQAGGKVGEFPIVSFKGVHKWSEFLYPNEYSGTFYGQPFKVDITYPPNW